jgi:alcohol dehydrogenase (cytochrome c)
VLADARWDGARRKLMLWANRNGFFYALDRTNGEFLAGHAFVKVNWASGLDDKGRPVPTPPAAEAAVYPGVQGGTNWYSPSYSPRTGLFYVSAWEDYASVFVKEESEYKEGDGFVGGRPATPIPGSPNPSLRGSPINTWTEAAGRGAVLALDIRTGQKKWRFGMHDVTDSGILTTGSDLLFTGGREGYFHALDARTGELLWKVSVGGSVSAAPVTYELEGKQYVAIAAGHALFVYGLR